MALLFGLLYFVLIIGVALTSFFIVTRLQKYSINQSFTRPLIIIYIFVTIILLVINISLFIQIPFGELFYNNLYY